MRQKKENEKFYPFEPQDMIFCKLVRNFSVCNDRRSQSRFAAIRLCLALFPFSKAKLHQISKNKIKFQK